MTEDKAYKVSCPMFKNAQRCEGALEVLVDATQLMAVNNDVDHNQHRQIFRCPVCGAVVQRLFTWEKIKDGT